MQNKIFSPETEWRQQRGCRVMIKILFTNATNVGISGTSDVSERNERYDRSIMV